MKEGAKVIIIPAKPEAEQAQCGRRQLRAAAYCRVSTDEEEQITSYKAQKEYYTDKIMTNPEWTLAGIYADEGITGTSARKRPEFLKMIRACKQKKIDLILTKSISRFSRNTVDCLNYTRILRSLGIAVLFEEQNINSLQPDSEFLITLHGAIAQNESENISKNVTWGKRHAMSKGRAIFQYKWLYAYEKGKDGEPKIIPEQAEVVRRIYREYLAGASLRMIREGLERDGVPDKQGKVNWDSTSIRRILSNEKYCGDVLLQKTYTKDFINKIVAKNTGQLPMTLVQNHHEGIVSRETFDAVQAEIARRNAGRSPSKKTPTGRTSYTSKYALSERLVCGECGTLYRRCTWTSGGKKRIVWRCVSRLDFGKKYCKHSPTLDEGPLQRAILAALNVAMRDKDELIREITGAMELELAPIPGEYMSLADIERRLEEIGGETKAILAKSAAAGSYSEYADRLKTLMDETAVLKEKRAYIQKEQENHTEANQRIKLAAEVMENCSADITEWDEPMIRQLVETVKVLAKDKIEVTLRGGVIMEQEIKE